MSNLLDCILLSPETSIMKAVGAIDASSLQIALVVDAERRLVGTVTDGDIRRGLLRGIKLDEAVDRVMNPKPHSISPDTDRQAIIRLMGELRVHQLPVTDAAGKIIGMEVLDDLINPASEGNWVVLMAGGLGMRLRPITDTVPKPMIPIGGRPLLENILSATAAQGFNRFFLGVNYKADIVRDYFGNGQNFGVRIDYLDEKERKGTAGALSLLPERPTQPLIVMNGDLLTSVNLRSLLDFHRDHRAVATMCVREYTIQIPFGVVETDVYRLTRIVEKPVQHYFINAGIYVIEPEALDLIPNDRMIDMPEIFQALLDLGKTTSVFPIHEYWLDIGHFDDLHRAQSEYGAVLKGTIL